MTQPTRTRTLLLGALVLAMAIAAGVADAAPLMSCSYSEGVREASASGDLAVCGPCLLQGGVCASARDLAP